MDGFLDTAVIIDIYRGYAPAVTWFQSKSSSLFAINPLTWLEAVDGAQNKIDQAKIVRLLRQFSMVYLLQSDMDTAMNWFESYHLSQGVGFEDCLIAAPPWRLQLPLYTRNLKHFTPLLNVLAQRPY